jgi:hypothetical protein
MDFQSLQKLRFFLAIIFPIIGRNLIKPEKADVWLERHPRLKSRLEHFRDSKLGSNLVNMNETFGTGNLTPENLDWDQIPEETSAILRTGIVVAVTVCILVPVTMLFTWPALSREAITGEVGNAVAGWSVILWMMSAALAWGCLLAGTAAANRVAFLPAILVFIYFMGAMTASLPRSWWNLALSLTAAGAVVLCEARSANVQAKKAWRGIITCVPAGMITGFIMTAATPAGRLVPGRVLLTGLSLGVPLGVGLWWCGRWLASCITARGSTPFLLRLDIAVLILAGLHLCLTTSLTVRGGILVPARELQHTAVQITGYLWPFYYFVGIGVVFKVLRQTTVVNMTVRELVPPRFFIPATLALLVVATTVAWSENLVQWLISRHASMLTSVIVALHASTAWIWSRPLLALTLEWFRWVLLAISAFAIWNTLRRRLDAGMMASFLFMTLFIGLGFYEYFFEFAGFIRSQVHTAVSLFTFSIFGLWMAHTTLRPFLTGESSWWPRSARIALYCAGLMFVLLPIHIRAAVHDGLLSSEIYLYLFFGIIDMGLPYYLFVYAGQRFRQMPLSISALLGLFGIGAVLSVPFTILDKLADSGWSIGAVWTIANAQVAASLKGVSPVVVMHFLPPTWIVVRSLLAMGAVLIVGSVVRRRIRGRELAPAATVFAVIATATGLACFANRSLELPLLPLGILQLITPMNVSRDIDVTLVARYLSFVIPAFLISLVLTHRSGWFARIAGFCMAILVHTAIAILWPAHEPWLRSTGVLFIAGAMGVVVLILLLVAVRNRLDTILTLRDGEDTGTPLVLWKELRAAGLALVILLALVSIWQLHERRMVTHEIGKPAVAVRLPAFWHNETKVSGMHGLQQFVASTNEPFPPRLTIDIRTGEIADVRTLLETAGAEVSQHLKGFAPTKLTRWDQFCPGTLALDFEFEAQIANTTFPAIGVIVVAPVRPGTLLVFTMVFTVGDRERRWDPARTLQTMPH